MKNYFYFWLASIALLFVGALIQPENYLLSTPTKASMAQLMGVVGLIFSMPIMLFLYRLSAVGKSKIKRLWHSVQSCAVIGIFSFIFFAIVGHGVFGHMVNLAAFEEVELSGKYAVVEKQPTRYTKPFHWVAPIVEVIEGDTKELSFLDDYSGKHYAIFLDSNLATNRTIYSDTVLSAYHMGKPKYKLRLKGRRSSWGYVFDKVEVVN